MKKLIFLFALIICSSLAGRADEPKRLFANVGIMAPYTLDATIGYEHPIGYGHAFSVYAEAGNHWETPVCHRFWHNYFWDGGGSYKHQIARWKNASLRVVGGMYFGAIRTDFFFGNELNLEFNYRFRNNWMFTLTQKNTINYLHGDLFRNGVMVGLKIPI